MPRPTGAGRPRTGSRPMRGAGRARPPRETSPPAIPTAGRGRPLPLTEGKPFNQTGANLSIGRRRIFQSDACQPFNRPYRKVTIGRWRPPRLYPRHAAPRLAEALEDSPVVLIHGPRQCGQDHPCPHVGGSEGLRLRQLRRRRAARSGGHRPRRFVAGLPERVILDRCKGRRRCSPRSSGRWIAAASPAASC